MAPLLIPLVAGLLPSLVKYLLPNNPVADIASAAVTGALHSVTGTRDPAQAATVLAAEPGKRAELIQALAKIEADRETAAAAMQMETVKAQLADMADARARDVAIRAGGDRNPRADVMLAITAVAILASLVFLYYGGADVPLDVRGAVLGIIGGMSKCFYDAFQFEFGSSRGSSDKSQTISRELASRPIGPFPWSPATQQQPTAVTTTGDVTVNQPAQPPDAPAFQPLDFSGMTSEPTAEQVMEKMAERNRRASSS